jgi:hypothetical protein
MASRLVFNPYCNDIPKARVDQVGLDVMAFGEIDGAVSPVGGEFADGDRATLAVCDQSGIRRRAQQVLRGEDVRKQDKGIDAEDDRHEGAASAGRVDLATCHLDADRSCARTVARRRTRMAGRS